MGVWGAGWGGYSRRLAPHIFLGLSTVHFLKCVRFIRCSVCIMQLISQTHASVPSEPPADFDWLSPCLVGQTSPPPSEESALVRGSFPEASGTCTYSLKHGVLNRAGKNTEPKEERNLKLLRWEASETPFSDFFLVVVFFFFFPDYMPSSIVSS